MHDETCTEFSAIFIRPIQFYLYKTKSKSTKLENIISQKCIKKLNP